MGPGTACCFCSESKPSKRRRVQFDGAEYSGEKADLFDCLPDDIVLSILCCLSASAERPSDLVSVMKTCKRMNGLGKNPPVLEKATLKSISIRAHNWSPPAREFLKRCADAGNLEACYLLGMIECYCLRKFRDGCHMRKGLSYLLRASKSGHAPATYSLAVIFFNGTGMGKSQKNLSTGFSLCQRATRLGYVDAIRELGHCLQDGYGVAKDVSRGRRLLVDANTRELAVSLSGQYSIAAAAALLGEEISLEAFNCSLHSDFGCNVPASEVHPANRFMAEWFQTRQNFGEGVRLCANANCSRPETRRFEFRVCSMCALACYCSRACQALHWKTVHRAACTSPIARRVWAAAIHIPTS